MYDRDEAIRELQKLLAPGDTVRTILRHTSSSGMTRHISLVIVRDGEVRDISWLAARAMEMKVNVGRHEGIKVGGCGMDMGFSLVYSLSRTLFPDGHPCSGVRGCPSNDHSNDYGAAQRDFWETSGEENLTVWSDSSEDERRAAKEQHARMRAHIESQMTAGPLGYHADRVHHDGGYALNHRWL